MKKIFIAVGFFILIAQSFLVYDLYCRLIPYEALYARYERLGPYEDLSAKVEANRKENIRLYNLFDQRLTENGIAPSVQPVMVAMRDEGLILTNNKEGKNEWEIQERKQIQSHIWSRS